MSQRVSLLNPRVGPCRCRPSRAKVLCDDCGKRVLKADAVEDYEVGPWDGEPGCGASGRTLYRCKPCDALAYPPKE